MSIDLESFKMAKFNGKDGGNLLITVCVTNDFELVLCKRSWRDKKMERLK